ncbi:MAG: hypothetical protein ABR915_01085 [Thermoguttaceae bacterium]
MFLRRCVRRKNGKPHTYGALVESYRTGRGSRQRLVAYLGELKRSEQNGCWPIFSSASWPTCSGRPWRDGCTAPSTTASAMLMPINHDAHACRVKLRATMPLTRARATIPITAMEN